MGRSEDGDPRAGRSGGRAVLLALLVGGIAAGCGGNPGTITGCEPADGLTPVCGFSNPEDLAILPGGNWIVVSQFPGVGGEGGGSLVAFRPVDGRRVTLFPRTARTAEPAAPPEEESWGAPDCPGPPDPEHFSPHGLDLDRRTHRLAVVNHGEREAVELFETVRSRQGIAVVWRGCVPLPEDAWGNDVALLADGSFLVTQMMDRGSAAQLLNVVKMLLGGNTGLVLEWTPKTGFREVPDSEGSAPNGIEATADGRYIYFAEWAGQRLVALERDESGNVVERRSVDLPHHPDNITWTRNGELLVTGQVGPLGEVVGCGSVEGGTCALPFSVVEVGPSTLDLRMLVDHRATAHGAGTVALEVGNELYIGTFAGDRLARTAFVR